MGEGEPTRHEIYFQGELAIATHLISSFSKEKSIFVRIREQLGCKSKNGLFPGSSKS